MTDAVQEAIYNVITKSGAFYDTELGSRFYMAGDAPDVLKFPYMTYTVVTATPDQWVMPITSDKRTSWTKVRVQFDIYADRHADSVTERDVHILGRRLKDVLHDATLTHNDFENGFAQWDSTIPHVEDDVYALTMDFIAQGHENPWG